ncbi:hypothetical protein AAMO2058_001759800, partial [Amorphochlora amoebiformis]
GTQTNISTGGNVVIPTTLPSDVLDTTQDVVIKAASFSENIYPTNDPSSGVLSISLSQNGTDSNVKDLSKYIEFSIPLGSIASKKKALSRTGDERAGAYIKKTYTNTTLLCRFWNETLGNWSTNGIITLGVTGDSMRCATNHLTTFNVIQKTIVSEVHIEINTISEDDITADAFSYKNPIMVFCCVVVGLWPIFLYLAFKHDVHIAKTQGESVSVEFWRKFNRMRRLRLSHRSWRHCLKMSRWGIQRRHPWLAILFRHPGDFMTSAKRVNILIVLLFCMMTTCALLVDTEQKLWSLPTTLASGIISAVLSGPVPVFLGYIHRRRVPPRFAVSLAERGLQYTCFSYLLILVTVFLAMEFEGDTGDAEEEGEGGDDEDKVKENDMENEDEAEDIKNADAGDMENEDEAEDIKDADAGQDQGEDIKATADADTNNGDEKVIKKNVDVEFQTKEEDAVTTVNPNEEADAEESNTVQATGGENDQKDNVRNQQFDMMVADDNHGAAQIKVNAIVIEESGNSAIPIGVTAGAIAGQHIGSNFLHDKRRPNREKQLLKNQFRIPNSSLKSTKRLDSPFDIIQRAASTPRSESPFEILERAASRTPQ